MNTYYYVIYHIFLEKVWYAIFNKILIMQICLYYKLKTLGLVKKVNLVLG